MNNKTSGWLACEVSNRSFALLSCLLLIFGIWIFKLDRALVSEAVPHGIVSFELAGSLESSRLILLAWAESEGAMQKAVLLQGIDYLFLFLYVGWLSIAVSRLGQTLSPGWQRLAELTSRLVLLAAPLDAVENYALIQQLFFGADHWYASLAWWCAVPKFLLVGLAVSYLGSGLLANLFAWRR